MANSPSRIALAALLGALAVTSPTAAAAAPGQADRLHVLELVSEFDQVPAARVLASLLIVRFGADGRFNVSNETPSLADQARYVKACDLKGFEPRVLREDADRRLDARCLRGVASRLDSSRLVVGFVYSGPDGRRWVKARLWQAGGPEVSKALPLETEPGARERLIDRLYLHLARPDQAADVKVTAPSSSTDGELFVDDKGQGPFAPGLELTVKAGEHAFELRREGKVVASAKAVTSAGKTTEVALAPTFTPRATIDPTEGFRDPPPVVIQPRRSAWPWVAGGVGVAGLAGAGVLYALRQGKESDLDDLCRGGDGCPPRARDDIDRSKLYGTLSLVSLGVGVAGVAASAALFLTESKRRETAAPALRVHGFVLPQPGGGAATLVGSF